MKATLLASFLLVFIFIASCSKESTPNCPPPAGEMIAHVNDTITWDFKYVTFLRNSEREFTEQWADSSIYIGAAFVNAGCEPELSLDFHNIAQIHEKQNLVKVIYEDGHASQLLPYSIFYTWDVDVLTEQFELFENEAAWIRLLEIEDSKIKGVFQATYIYRPSAFRYWDLPDTLRFNQVAFEAQLFDLPEE